MAKLLLRNAHVATFANDLEGADILIDGSTIEQVGKGLPSEGAEVMDCTGMVVMPGMADTHTHLWEGLFRGRVSDAWGMEYFSNIPPLGSHLTPDDMYWGVYAEAVQLLANGVTSVLDYCHAILSPDHADAAVRALHDAGIRALFGYDLRGRDPGGKGVLGPSAARFDDIRRVQADIEANESRLVELGVCVNTIDANNVAQVRDEIEFARDIGAQMSFHNNKGGELVLLGRHGLLGRDILPAHCNYTTDEDLAALSEAEGFISTQPEAETYAGRRPYSMVGRAHKRGVRVALGVDVPALVNSAILTQMRLLYLLQRYMDGNHERYEGQVPIARRPGWPQLETTDVLRFGTVDGVDSLGFADPVGRIEPGHQADLVVLDARSFGVSESGLASHVVMNASLGDVHSVLVAGSFRKKAGQLVGVDVEGMLEHRLAARARVLAAAGELGAGGMVRTHWDWVQTD